MKTHVHSIALLSASALLALFAFARLALSQGPVPSPDPQSFAGKTEMNGYTYSQFAGFEKKWNLVTVRYRKDTGEMRFTYANPKAWEYLSRGKTDYPKGAVFAKIGIATEADPAFPSSAVPSGARRTQFMVRDLAKHKETDGWGYALFDENGKTFPEEPRAQTLACAACHRLVPGRGQVFSEIMNLARGAAPGAKRFADALRLKFETWPAAKLPEYLRARLPRDSREVRILTGELRRHLFQGTLDEVRPALAEESLRTGLAALLLSEDEKKYSVVFRDPAAAPCESPKKVSLRAEHNIFSQPEKRYELVFCKTPPAR